LFTTEGPENPIAGKQRNAIVAYFNIIIFDFLGIALVRDEPARNIFG
jgi:hypothetical protein